MFRKDIRVEDMSLSSPKNDNLQFTDILFKRVLKIWNKEVNNDFMVQMAKGILDIDRFKNYMMQDYFYLLDYLDVLKSLKQFCANYHLCDFIDKMIEGTMHETYAVHVPYMNKIGITEAEIFNCKVEPVIKDYIAYMKLCIKNHGMLGGLVMLLQCSWGYAYISEKAWHCHGNNKNIVYKDWFDAYASQSYLDANQEWIDIVNEKCRFIDSSEAEELCQIFINCAKFETQFWSVL